MRKMKKINGYLVVRFNDREKREYTGTGLGSFGVIDAELYTGILDIDRGAMEYDDAETLEIAMEQARGLEAELDVEEPEVKITVIIEGDTDISEEVIEPERLFLDRKALLETQLKSGQCVGLDPRAASHELSGYARALEDMGMIDGFDERFAAAPEIFDTGAPPLPPSERFKHLPQQFNEQQSLKIYRLGTMLTEKSPENDCTIYRNTFRMAQELDNALDTLTGYTARVVNQKLAQLFRELQTMFEENYAIGKYRMEVQV